MKIPKDIIIYALAFVLGGLLATLGNDQVTREITIDNDFTEVSSADH